MERKFSENLEIKLDDHQNRIVNKTIIFDEINKIEDLDTIEDVRKYYFRIYEMSNSTNKKELQEIAEKLNERTAAIKSEKNTLQEIFSEAKEKNDNLKNINLIKTEKEDNDKINGLRREVTYLQITVDGKKELYEVTNENAVNNILNNKELLEKMDEKELISALKEYAKKSDTTEIDTRQNDSLNSDTIKAEINRISDPYVKEAFEKAENIVLKERVDIKKYVDEHMPGTKIEYGLNSNGERIYMVDDKIIKFVGEEREMKILTEEEKKSDEVNTANFDTELKGVGEIEEINLYDFNTLEDFKNSTKFLNYIIESISLDMGVTDNQIDFLTLFMEKCVEREEFILEQDKRIKEASSLGNSIDEIRLHIPGELETIYELYYGFVKENPKYTNSEIAKIIARKEEIEKQKPEELKKDNTVKLDQRLKELKLTNNNKLTPLEKAGFISVTIILEATIIIGGILSILALVKK